MNAVLPNSGIQNIDDRLAGLDGADLIAAMVSDFGDQFVIVSSFGTESAVLLHLAAQISTDIPVIFLNTGKLFGETLRYQRTLIERLGLTHVQSIEPDSATISDQDPNGTLWAENADQCCLIRKVQPLAKALRNYTAWATGRKSYQRGARSVLETVEADGSRIKVNPLAKWTAAQIQAYFEDHDLPRHPLQTDGYDSVGCMPCTTPTESHEVSRDGRWREQDKTECGIHLPGLVNEADADL